MDLLKDAICNELRLSLDRWCKLNDMIERGEKVTKAEHNSLRFKIQDLERRLEGMSDQEVA